MPCLRNDFASSAETASSSTGTSRGNSSMIVTSLPNRAKIDADATGGNRKAPVLRVLHDLQRMRVFEQRLRRNAAPIQAGAAQRFLLLDDGRLEPELRGADRGDVAAGAGADHNHVVFVGHG